MTIAASNLLPNLLTIGAAKCGTTSLHDLLQSHSSIDMSHPKELEVFSWPDWRSRLARYQGQFSRTAVFRGESTPSYLHDPEGPAKLVETLGADLKLLCILRHPTDRAYSHFWHSVRIGRERLSFEEALELEQQRIAHDFEEWRIFSYVSRGYYDIYLDRYRDAFGDRLLVLGFHDLLTDEAGTMAKIFEFLGVGIEGWQQPAPVHRNPARQPRSRSLHKVFAWAHRNGVTPLAKLIDKVNMKAAPNPRMNPSTQRQLDDLFAPTLERVASKYGVDLNRGRNFVDAPPANLSLAGPDCRCWALPELRQQPVRQTLRS